MRTILLAAALALPSFASATEATLDVEACGTTSEHLSDWAYYTLESGYAPDLDIVILDEPAPWPWMPCNCDVLMTLPGGTQLRGLISVFEVFDDEYAVLWITPVDRDVRAEIQASVAVLFEGGQGVTHTRLKLDLDDVPYVQTR